MNASETRTRILTAAWIAPLSLAMMAAGGWVWALYATVIAIICQIEFFEIMAQKGHQPMRNVAIGVTVALMAVAEFAGMEFAAGMLTVGILALLIRQLIEAGGGRGSAISNISVTLAGVLYVGWLLSHGVVLRHLTTSDGQDVGFFAVFFVLATTLLSDTGGYFAGRAYGKHKIAPKISPKKSWEGLLGSIAFAGLAGVVVGLIFDLLGYQVPYAWYVLLVLGMANSIVGFFGDLVESLLKRDADVKDSGSLLPGHGGMLDRIDGVLFTLPFSYYVFLFLNRFIY